jgi:GT2 family glycosyltransferase
MNGTDLQKNLHIVIPVHNRSGFTRNCLAQLHAQSLRGFRIIVVDDGSTDGTAEMIKREFPEVNLIRGDGSLWWTAATNLGVKSALEAGASHIMTLNDDTVPGTTFIENMMEAAAEKPGALIGAYAVDAESGRAVFAGSRVNWLTGSFTDLSIEPEGLGGGFVEVTHYPGRGLLIPAEVFRKTGLFDSEHLPHYLADYDFTHRARRSGFPIFCCYSAPLGIYPEASGDAENRQRRSIRKYYRHLFQIKGGANLKDFFWYAAHNCPKPLLPLCLPVGIVRRVLGYPLDWALEVGAAWRTTS